MRILRQKRAVNNIIATMLIFAMMIVSMGILYSQISPTILGFNARTLSTNQEFLLLSIENEMENLISSAEGAQTRINVVSDNGLYNVSSGHALTINIFDGVGALIDPAATISENIGDFSIDVAGTFEYEVNERYLTQVRDENSLIQGDDDTDSANFVSKVKYSSDNAHYEFYSRSRIDIIETSPNVFSVTISVIKIVYQSLGSTPLDFPIQDSEWSLRLRRMPGVITESTSTATGPFAINHTIDAVQSPVSYSFGTSVSSTINLRFVVIPILFSI